MAELPEKILRVPVDRARANETALGHVFLHVLTQDKVQNDLEFL